MRLIFATTVVLAVAGAACAIWVRSIPTTPVGSGTLYDVIDRNGRMVDRVLFDHERILLGVAGGNAYLAAGPVGSRHLERVVIGGGQH